MIINGFNTQLFNTSGINFEANGLVYFNDGSWIDFHSELLLGKGPEWINSFNESGLKSLIGYYASFSDGQFIDFQSQVLDTKGMKWIEGYADSSVLVILGELVTYESGQMIDFSSSLVEFGINLLSSYSDLPFAGIFGDLVSFGNGELILDFSEGSSLRQELDTNTINQQVHEPIIRRGDSGSNYLHGGGGSDELVALRGRDYLNGYNGNDILRAGNGRDTIKGGAGKDVMYGGFGHNTFADALDNEIDQLIFKSDQFAYNYIYDKAGNNTDGQKVDILEELDNFDQIRIQGVITDQLSFESVSNLATPSGLMNGIGIFADGYIEAVYTGSNLSINQLQQMTEGLPINS